MKAATGEVVTAEDLGGGDVHARTSGVVDHLAADDAEALAIVRSIVGTLERRTATIPGPARAGGAGRGPEHAVRRRAGRHPDAVRRPRGDPSDRRRVAAARVQGAVRRDAGVRLRADLGLPGRHRRQQRHPVQRVVSLKGAHFIELCNQRGIPLVFLQNITGFMVGSPVRGRRHRQGRRQAGHGGGLLGGAEVHRGDRRLVRRRQLRDVRPGLRPAVPVDVAERPHLGDGWRAGRVGARDRAPRRHRGRWRASGRADDEEAFKAPIRDQYETQGSPYYSTARLWDDGIIDPVDTRRVLGMGLAAAANAPVPEPSYGIFRM